MGQGPGPPVPSPPTQRDGGGGPAIAEDHVNANSQAHSGAWDIVCFDCL